MSEEEPRDEGGAKRGGTSQEMSGRSQRGGRGQGEEPRRIKDEPREGREEQKWARRSQDRREGPMGGQDGEEEPR